MKKDLRISLSKPFANKKHFTRKTQDYIWAYIMIAPTIIGLCILNIWPILQTFYLSFFKQIGFAPAHWVGLSNYIGMFTNQDIFRSILNTFVYTIITVPVGIFLSLIIALLLNSNIKGKSIYRTIYFLPVVSVSAAVAMVWRWLLNADYGIINYLLSLVGIKGPNWIADPKIAIITIIIVGIWSGLGYNMIIFLAGLQEISQTYYEAADIDGANAFRKFINITIPLVSPTMFFVVITTMISSLQVFDYIYMIVDKGNPALPYVQSLLYIFYKYSFSMGDKGYGSAVAMLLLVIILIITLIQLKLQKKWVHYD
ncbi:MAG: carbohydrate ABC transporter permease [Acetanaerobacterium sp.]